MNYSLLKQSFDELKGRPIRSILLILSVFIGAIMISISISASGMMENVLLSMLASSTNAEKQIMVFPGGGTDKYDEIAGFIEENAACDSRIELRLPITKVMVNIGGIQTTVASPYIYDGEKSLITKGEEKLIVTNRSGIDYKQGITLNPFFVEELGLSDYKPTEADSISISYINKSGETVTEAIPIRYMMNKNEYGVINKNNHADFFVNSKELPLDDMLVVAYDSVLMEYTTYEEAKDKADNLLSQGKIIKYSDEAVQIIKSDAAVYKVICRIFETILVAAIIGCVFITVNVNYIEKLRYYGMLKAIGYNNRMLFELSFYQIMLIAFFSAGFGYTVVVCAGEHITEWFMNAILFSKVESLDVKLPFNIQDLIKVVSVVLISCFMGGVWPYIKLIKQNATELLNEN